MHTHPESTGAKFGTLEQTSVYGPVSVCLTQIDVLLRQLNKGSHKQYHAIAQWFSFSDAKDYSEIPPGLTPTGAPNAGGWVKIGDFRQITHYISKTVQGRHTHTHTRLTALFPGLPRWAGTRKVKPIWILLEQETVSGSGISRAICKSAPCSRQIPRQHPTTQFFTGRMPFLPPNQQHQSTEGTHRHTVSVKVE